MSEDREEAAPPPELVAGVEWWRLEEELVRLTADEPMLWMGRLIGVMGDAAVERKCRCDPHAYCWMAEAAEAAGAALGSEGVR